MKNRKAMIIVGGTAAERTQEARRHAAAVGCPCFVTTWDEFCLESDFANVLKVKPEVVVVEGMPASLSAKKTGLLKSRLGGDTITYRPLYSREVFVAWNPVFIFTVAETLPESIAENMSLGRRFDVVEI